MQPTRDDARQLLTEHVSSESLRKHCRAVEAAMCVYARVYGEDEELWGLAGLLHDFDYERYPSHEWRGSPELSSGHPFEGVRLLRSRGYPDAVCEAILGHAAYSGVLRASHMAKCLYAVDELCGFVVATAYVRPTRFDGMTAQSIEKNLKKKGFAATISREDIDRGIAELGVDRVLHFERVIEALRSVAPSLGF